MKKLIMSMIGVVALLSLLAVVNAQVYDSDNGIKPFQYGWVEWDGIRLFDYCTGNILTEYYVVNGGTTKTIDYNCTKGCMTNYLKDIKSLYPNNVSVYGYPYIFIGHNVAFCRGAGGDPSGKPNTVLITTPTADNIETPKNKSYPNVTIIDGFILRQSEHDDVNKVKGATVDVTCNGTTLKDKSDKRGFYRVEFLNDTCPMFSWVTACATKHPRSGCATKQLLRNTSLINILALDVLIGEEDD